jgi:hypothetical protein
VVRQRTLQEEENRRLESVEPIPKILQTIGSRRSSEGVNSQEHGGVRLLFHLGLSGLASARSTCTSKSRMAILRFNRSHQSLEGQVARDPEDSGLGTSVFAKSKGARINRKAASCDGSHGDCVEYNTWHRASALGVWRRKVFDIVSGDIQRVDR